MTRYDFLRCPECGREEQVLPGSEGWCVRWHGKPMKMVPKGEPSPAGIGLSPVASDPSQESPVS